MVAEGLAVNEMATVVGESLGSAAGAAVSTIGHAIESFNQSEIGQSLLNQIHNIAEKTEQCVAKNVDLNLDMSDIKDEVGSRIATSVAAHTAVDAVRDFAEDISDAFGDKSEDKGIEEPDVL